MEQGLEGPLPHFVAQDGGDVLVGVAGVDDQRQARVGGPPRYACGRRVAATSRGLLS